MADHYLGALKELERRTHDNKLIFSTILSERLDDITQAMIQEPISDNDYMKVMELYYQKYFKMEKKKAMMYCLLRIQQINEYKKKPRLQKQVHLIEFSSEYDSYTLEFLNKKRDYHKRLLVNYKKRALLLSFLFMVFLLTLIVLVFKFPFLFGWIVSILVYVISYFFIIQKGFPAFYEAHLDSLKEELDVLNLSLDEGIFTGK